MNKQTDLFQGFTLPKTSEQEVLLTLITQSTISIFDFPYLSGYRTRISELQTKRFLYLDREEKTKKNKFGNTYRYAVHKLSESEKPKAIALYQKLNSQ